MLHNVGDFSFPDDLVLSRTICQVVGILGLFLLYSGSSLHGGICREGHRQQDGILLPTFFSSYLMAEKVTRGNVEKEENYEEDVEKDQSVAADQEESFNEEEKDGNFDNKGVENEAFEDESKL